MKLTLEHLAPYLPYGLKAFTKNGGKCILSPYGGTLKGVYLIDIHSFVSNECYYKPILRPLSDYADINSEAMNNLSTDLMIQIEISEFACKQKGLSNLSYAAYEELIRDKADVFGLIEQRLAIDINTLTL